MAKYTSIGGQALIEGVMMKSSEKTAMAVRTADGGIDVSYLPQNSVRDKYKVFALPVIRGVAAFAESMIGGYKAMMKSADISGLTDLEETPKSAGRKKTAETAAAGDGTEEATETAEADNARESDTEPDQGDKTETAKENEFEKADNTGKSDEEPDQGDKTETAKENEFEKADNTGKSDEEPDQGDKTETAKENEFDKTDNTGKPDINSDKADKEETAKTVVSVVSAVLGVALAVVLFMLLPRLAAGGLQKLSGVRFSSAARAAIEQAIKLVVLVAYMWAVSLIKDIRRVFMYHGAEHKTIFCYEHNKPLTVENVRRERRFHPRCGTSFMILMILVSFIVSTAVQLIFKGVYENAAVWVAVKILMIPLVCGLGFELLRVCGRHDNLFTKIVSAPGMWLQRITTKEPDDGMIETAIAALRACEPETPDVDRSVDGKSAPDGAQQ